MKYIILCCKDNSMMLIDCLHGEKAKIRKMYYTEFDSGEMHTLYTCRPFAIWFDSLQELANEFVQLNDECKVVE